MSNPYLLVRVGGEPVVFQADRIEQVIELERLVPVPLAPPHVVGITTLRSRILTVIDVAAAVGVESPARGETRTAVTAERDGCGFAFVVDAADAVFTSGEAFEPLAIDVRARWADHALGVIGTPAGKALVCDLDRLIGRDRRDRAA